LDKYEIRGSRFGALDFVLRDAANAGGIATEDLKNKYFSSIGSTVETPVIDYDGGISIGSSRSTTISDSENTSAMQTISSTVYSWGFTMVPQLYNNNEIGYQKDFEKKFWKYAWLFLTTLDSACVTLLDTYKNQVHTNVLPIYTEASDVVIAALANELRLLGDVGPMMEANDYFGQLHLVGNTGFQSIISRLQQQGTFNNENKQLQYLDKILHYTNRISNAGGHGSTFFAVNEGSTAIMTRVDREALNRTKSKANGREWDVMTFPILDLPVGTQYYESDGDFNAIAGAASADMTAAHKEHFGFSVDVALFANYNSDIATRANPIAKYAVATS